MRLICTQYTILFSLVGEPSHVLNHAPFFSSLASMRLIHELVVCLIYPSMRLVWGLWGGSEHRFELTTA